MDTKERKKDRFGAYIDTEEADTVAGIPAVSNMGHFLNKSSIG